MLTHGLATRCPQCQTIFRVVSDQLKLKDGFVRCGVCQAVFNGTQNLLDEKTLTPQLIVKTDTEILSDSLKHTVVQGAAEINKNQQIELSHFAEPNPELVNQAVDPLNQEISFGHATLIATNSKEQENTDVEYEIAEAEPLVASHTEIFKDEHSATATENQSPRDTLESKPVSSDVSFIHGKPRSLFFRYLPSLNIVLIVVLFLQILIWNPNYFFAYFPSLQPYWNAVCKPLGCKSLLPAQISELSLESSELQENPQNPEQLVLVALIRNHAAYAQQWPHLSLTLKDANEQIIARRILTPKEYLAFDPTLQANLKAGISENSEQSIQVIFALKEYKVTGYQVNLFYPSV